MFTCHTFVFHGTFEHDNDTKLHKMFCYIKQTILPWDDRNFFSMILFGNFYEASSLLRRPIFWSFTVVCIDLYLTSFQAYTLFCIGSL